MASRPVRSLADTLRARTDTELAALFNARPDLISPLPTDLAAVAARAATRASVHRVLAGLDLPTVQVAMALTALPSPATLGELARACQTSTARIRPLLERLLDLALAFGSTRAAHPVRALQEVLGPHPAGLGPPLADLLMTSPARLANACAAVGVPLDAAALATHLRAHATDLLQAAPAECTTLLATLDESGPVGSVRNATRQPDPDDASPLGWLLARAMVLPVDEDHVIVPREVGMSLRGGVLRLAAPPESPQASLDQDTVNRLAPGTVWEIVRQTSDLIDELDRAAAPVLRNGGMAAREVVRLGRALHADHATTSLVLVLATGARLIAVDDTADPHLRPTVEGDRWLAAGTGARWVELVHGWLAAPWAASLAGARDARGTLCAALSPATERDAERRLRRDVLEALVQAPPGTAHTPDSVTATLRFRSPRGPVAAAARLVPVVLGEAHRLGLLAADCLPEFARDVLGADGKAATALDALLPSPVATVLVQADLTAIAPGPLTRPAQHLLDLAADIESRGAATVFRFTPGSVQRALDAGRDAQTLLTDLAKISAGPLPQPLEYLVRDVARRHGRVRVGAAGSYLRSDDPETLTELLALPQLRGLGWQRLAPTVVAAPNDPSRTLELLRLAGVAAVAEDADGELLLPGQVRMRAPVRDLGGRTTQPPHRDPAQVAEVIRVLRLASQAVGSATATTGPPSSPVSPAQPMSITSSLARLRAAGTAEETVWITFSDGTGEPQSLLVQPLIVDGGQARVIDVGTGQVRTVPAHRLLGVQGPTS